MVLMTPTFRQWASVSTRHSLPDWMVDVIPDPIHLLQELPCGHFMHSHCFAQYTRYNYTCPLCAKSLGDMSVYFRMIDSLVEHDWASLPVPYQNRQQVSRLFVYHEVICSIREKSVVQSRARWTVIAIKA